MNNVKSTILMLMLRFYKEKFTAIYEEMDGGWIGYVEELPGANTQGYTKEEVRENLVEAVQLIIDAKL